MNSLVTRDDNSIGLFKAEEEEELEGPLVDFCLLFFGKCGLFFLVGFDSFDHVIPVLGDVLAVLHLGFHIEL